ncbi:MAG: flagellar FlbD family protein [Polyangia bacterium]
MDNRMIFLTRFDGSEVVVNSDLILTVEKIPDTVLTLTTGDRIMVKEGVEEVVARAIAYRHRVMQGPGVRGDVQDIAASLAESARYVQAAQPPQPAPLIPRGVGRASDPSDGKDS